MVGAMEGAGTVEAVTGIREMPDGGCGWFETGVRCAAGAADADGSSVDCRASGTLPRIFDRLPGMKISIGNDQLL